MEEHDSMAAFGSRKNDACCVSNAEVTSIAYGACFGLASRDCEQLL